MSILEKYHKVFEEKDEAGMNEIIHDDFKFTMHASGNVLSKSDVITWAMSDDITEDKSRIDNLLNTKLYFKLFFSPL